MTVASSPPSRLPVRDIEGTQPKPRTREKRERDGGGRGDGALAALFIAPAMLGFLVFLLWPTLRGIYLSFTRFNLLTPAEWVGLDNYVRMVQDPIFWDSLKVTVEYVFINIGVQTVSALAIAVMMQRLTQSAAAGRRPDAVPDVERRRRHRLALDARHQLGIGNEIIAGIGLRPDPVPVGRDLGDPDHRADQRLAARRLHRAAALRRPAGHPETTCTRPRRWTAPASGGCSGASPCRCCAPVLALVLIMTVIGSFQVFDTVAVTTRGGPANASNVLQYYIYGVAFGRFQFGYASAMSVALLVVLARSPSPVPAHPRRPDRPRLIGRDTVMAAVTTHHRLRRPYDAPGPGPPSGG
jgi:multiple sugar transport system permease protein